MINQNRSVIAAFAAGMISFYLAAKIPEAASYWQNRAPLRRLESQAKKLDIHYSDAVKNPLNAAGKPVVWLITHPNRDRWFYNGDVGKPVSWDGPPPDMVETGVSGSSYGQEVAAHIVKVKSDEIVLKAYVVSIKEKAISSYETSR